MPGYGTIATARNLRLIDLVATSNIGIVFETAPDELIRLLKDPCYSKVDDHIDRLDLERIIPNPYNLDCVLFGLTAARDIFYLTTMLIALPMAYFTFVGVPVAACPSRSGGVWAIPRGAFSGPWFPWAWLRMRHFVAFGACRFRMGGMWERR